MIIDVNNGAREPIEGIARIASIQRLGDNATVSVAADDLIRPPCPEQGLTMLRETWTVVRTTARNAHALTFTCRRL